MLSVSGHVPEQALMSAAKCFSVVTAVAASSGAAGHVASTRRLLPFVPCEPTPFQGPFHHGTEADEDLPMCQFPSNLHPYAPIDSKLGDKADESSSKCSISNSTLECELSTFSVADLEESTPFASLLTQAAPSDDLADALDDRPPAPMVLPLSASLQTATQQIEIQTLVEQRTRLIRSRPKNMSPLDANLYPSLLTGQIPEMKGRKTLVLDLDETLVHSSYTKLDRYDAHLKLPVGEEQIDVFVAFRPFLREFLDAAAELFEVVIFTASVSIYCNPLMDIIDPEGKLGGFRLSREHCSYSNGTYIKDLSLLGRPLDHIAIVDNSPAAYLFQPRNAIPTVTWFNDECDHELLDTMQLLYKLADADSVYHVLDRYNAAYQLVQECTSMKSGF